MLLVTVCFVSQTTGAVLLFQDEAVTLLYATVPLGCHAVAGVCHVCRLIELPGTDGWFLYTSVVMPNGNFPIEYASADVRGNDVSTWQ